MACTISLPFWPVSLDWSKDNRILAVGEADICVLTPRLRQDAANGPYWDSKTVTVNAFSSAEVPLLSPLSDANFSIGEEVSTYQAISATWSSPGLAMYGASAFAVLTSNHVLSIWSNEGRRGRRDWKRVAIANHAVKKYYAQRKHGDVRDRGSDGARMLKEQAQVDQRIHAFAWSPALYTSQERSHPYLFSGAHFLAVATGAGEVLIFHVDSPHSDSMGIRSQWTITFAGALSIEIPSEKAILTEPTPREARMQRPKSVVEHLAWSEWQKDEAGKGAVTTLAYIVSGKLFTVRVGDDRTDRTGWQATTISNHQWHSPCVNVRGPLRYVNGSAIACGPNVVYQLHSNTSQLCSVHLDDTWHDVSGLAVSADQLHLVYQYPNENTSAVSLRLPLSTDGSAMELEPIWEDAVNEARATDLEEQIRTTQTYIRGIAASPMCGYIATCTSVHTSGNVANIGDGSQSSSLNVTLECNFDNDSTFSGAQHPVDIVPIGTIWFYLRQCLHRRPQFQAASTTLYEHVVNEILRNMPPSPSGLESAPSTTTSSDIIIHLKEQVFGGPDGPRLRASYIAGLALDNHTQRAESVRVIFGRLVRTVTDIPCDNLSVDGINMVIAKTYCLALSKLDARQSAGDSNEAVERCDMCQQTIAFENIKWARCKQGHRFARCTLTLLSIQQPGMTKKCSVCDLVYLEETALLTDAAVSASGDVEMVDVPEVDSNNTPARERWINLSRKDGGDGANAASTMTLAKVLFAACDRCIYCGGMFTD